MKIELRLFFKWGIQFEEEYEVEQHMARPVFYAERLELEQEIIRRQMSEDEGDFDEPGDFIAEGVPPRGIFKRSERTEECRTPLRTD